jgi:Zn-dependent alcohol dehydrogenase
MTVLLELSLTQPIRYHDDGSIELYEIDVTDPVPNEVQVACGACGICSWDLATAKMGNNLKPMASRDLKVSDM